MTTVPLLDRLSTLADSSRSRLLLLLDRHELTVTELCAVLQLPQSTVSRHLKMLSDDGWLVSRAEGTSRYYRRSNGLDESAQQLWDLVRGDVATASTAAEDGRRVEAVLAGRRATSRTFFRTAAGRWDAVREELFGARVDLHVALGFLDPECTVGDLGCGTGHLTSLLAPVAGRVIAVDGSEDMLGAARGRLGAAPNVEFRLGDLERLPVASGELDVAALSLVLHYVAEPSAVLSEACRALKPGGRVVLIDMLPHGRTEYREQMGHVWQGFSQSQVTEWMTVAGFEAIRLRRLPMDPGAKGPEMFVATGKATEQDAGRRSEKTTSAREARPSHPHT